MAPRVCVRAAAGADHPVFVRLFPELEVDDPILDEAQFVRTLVPTTLIAESNDGSPAGYAYFQIMKDVAYVRHVVTAPAARRTGVARALLAAIVEQARAAGCTAWCLNVKPGNTPAITLYEALGLRRAHTSRALDMTWRAIDAAPAPDARVMAKAIAPEDDARVETATKLLDGQLAGARAVTGRVLKMLEEEDGRVVGATIFHPDFPGAYPFRVTRPELAVVLLRALRPHALPAHTKLGVVTEGQPEVADALLALGATLKLDIVHMKGALPDTKAVT